MSFDLPFNATLYIMKSIENVMKMLRFAIVELALFSCITNPYV